jgi:hypothetical protein
MTKLFFGGFLYIMSLLTHAADASSEVPAAAEVNAWAMIIFTLLFVGMVGGFFWFVWIKERERKRGELERKPEPQ